MNCIANAHRVTEYARRFTRGHWSFLVQECLHLVVGISGTELMSASQMVNGTLRLKS